MEDIWEDAWEESEDTRRIGRRSKNWEMVEELEELGDGGCIGILRDVGLPLVGTPLNGSERFTERRGD
jgi:hypothetical protein